MNGRIVQPARGRRRRAFSVTVMRQSGMAAYVPMKWADYRKPHPWENLSKVEKRAQCVLQAYWTEASDHRTFTTE